MQYACSLQGFEAARDWRICGRTADRDGQSPAIWSMEREILARPLWNLKLGWPGGSWSLLPLLARRRYEGPLCPLPMLSVAWPPVQYTRRSIWYFASLFPQRFDQSSRYSASCVGCMYFFSLRVQEKDLGHVSRNSRSLFIKDPGYPRREYHYHLLMEN